jgi:hypothetical protein
MFLLCLPLPRYIYLNPPIGEVILGNVNTVRVFETRVLRRIFGPRRDEVTGDWRLEEAAQ